MVVAHETRPRATAAGRALTLPSRVIAVGVRDSGYDAAVLRWLEDEAVAGADAVHLVHAYVPSGLDHARAVVERRVAADAVQLVRTARPDLLVEGCAVQGLPDDVLHEFSSVVDLLVIGEASSGPARKTMWRIQQRAHCPVVAVPRDRRAPRAGQVTLVLTASGPSEAALRFAADSAVRHGAPLNVIREFATHDADALVNAAGETRLLVLSHHAAALLREHPPLRCPVAVVPDRKCE